MYCEYLPIPNSQGGPSSGLMVPISSHAGTTYWGSLVGWMPVALNASFNTLPLTKAQGPEKHEEGMG